jgi:hypothetical protein
MQNCLSKLKISAICHQLKKSRMYQNIWRYQKIHSALFFQPLAYLTILNNGVGKDSNVLLIPSNDRAKCCNQIIRILFYVPLGKQENEPEYLSENLRPKLNVLLRTTFPKSTYGSLALKPTVLNN